MGDWFNINTFLPKLDHIYDHRQVETINKTRRELGGTLFFDRIWNSLGLSPTIPATKIYPPKSAQELKQLWQKVLKADSEETTQATVTATTERKQAVLFYILRDCARQQQTSSSKSSNSATTPVDPSIKFARAVYLPRKYQTLVSGLWELDHLQFPLALSHLTDPIVGSEFTAEIMNVLLTHQSCEREMALAYFHAKSPALDRSEIREGVFQLLLEANVVEAYKFCLQQPDDARRVLFLDLVEYVLSQEQGLQKATDTKMIIALALSTEEDLWLEEFLLSGGGSKLPGAKDTVIMRRFACGKSIDGIAALAGYRGQTAGGIDWDDVRRGLQSTVV